MARGFGGSRYQIFVSDVSKYRGTSKKQQRSGKGYAKKFGSKTKPTALQIQKWKGNGDSYRVKVVDMMKGWV